MALDERRLDKNAEGWFSVPWRDGWNAVSLGHAAYFLLDYRAPSTVSSVAADLGLWLSERRTDAFAYWNIDDAIAEVGRASLMLRAALRCMQIVIARSDGGGEVYNAILRPAFDSYTPEAIESVIEPIRCLDALGFGSPGATHPESYERRKKAFQIAWRRGLYRAAYAL